MSLICFDTKNTKRIYHKSYRCFINSHEDSQGCRNDLSMRCIVVLTKFNSANGITLISMCLFGTHGLYRGGGSKS